MCIWLLFAFPTIASGASLFNLTLITTSGTNSSYTPIKVDGVTRNYGGYAALKTAVSDIKAHVTAPTLAIHGINALGFSTFSQVYQGAKEYGYLDQIGFEYITFGTRDFFYGPDTYANNFLSNSQLTCIASNALISKSLALSSYVKPYIIVPITDPNTNTDATVAIISYATQDFCIRSQCSGDSHSAAQIQIEPASAMQEIVKDLIFVENPDVIVALSSGTDWSADLEIAKSVEGIDVIFSSDDKTVLGAATYPTVVQGPTGQNVLVINDKMSIGAIHGLGRLDISFVDGKPSAWSGSLNPVMSCQDDSTPLPTCIEPDAALITQINDDLQPVIDAMGAIIGETLEMLDGRQEADGHPCRNGECSAGSALADAVLWNMGNQCDAAMVNGGGIRAPIPQGDVTLNNIMAMLPNKNNVAVSRLRGADIFDALSSGLSRIGVSGSGRFPQVGNLKFTFNKNNPANLRLVSVQIYDKTKNEYVPMDPEGVYNLCVNDYMLGGGDGYTVLQTNSLYKFDQGPQLDVVLREYIADKTPLPAPVAGRITNLATSSETPVTPPIIGTCKVGTTANSASGNLSDACDGGYRQRSDLSWTVTPTSPNTRSIYFTFSDFTLDPNTDTLYLINPATNTPILVRSPIDNTTMVPANYTTLPKAVDIPNTASITVRLVTNRPVTGAGLKLSYNSDAGCPGGYILGATKCDSCPAGSFANKGDTGCTTCPAGRVTGGEGMDQCMVCTEPSFAESVGGTTCHPCDGGRVWTSASECSCPHGNYWNDFTCLPIPASKAETGQIVGIAVGLVVAGAGVAFYVHRRRMATLKRRQMGSRKQKSLKADVAMKQLLHDIGISIFLIVMDGGECFLDWHAFLTVASDDKYRLGYIAACIFQSLITVSSAAIRIYNIQALFKIRTVGVKLIAAGARCTSFEAMQRVKDAETDADLHLALLNLKTLKQKVVITIAVAAPGVLKSLPMLIVNVLVANTEGSDMALLLSFGYNCLVFAINVQESLGWFHLRHQYTKQKHLADAKLKDLGLARPDALRRLGTNMGTGNHPSSMVENNRSVIENNRSIAGGSRRESRLHPGPSVGFGPEVEHDGAAAKPVPIMFIEKIKEADVAEQGMYPKVGDDHDDDGRGHDIA